MLYTLREVAEAMGVTYQTAYRYAYRWNLGEWKYGKILLTADELEYIRKNRGSPGKPRVK